MSGDADGDGELDFAEFEYQLNQPLTTRVFQALEVPLTDARELFGMLDVDGDGYVTIEEFKAGILMMKG